MKPLIKNVVVEVVEVVVLCCISEQDLPVSHPTSTSTSLHLVLLFHHFPP